MRGTVNNASENVPIAYWNRDDGQAKLNRNDRDNRNDNYGRRSAVKVGVVFNDFIQPPSILPTSMSACCVWNIFVSFAILSSKNNRNLRMATSLCPLAFKRCALLSGLGAFLAITSSDRQSRTLCSKLAPSEYRKRFSVCAVMSTTDLYTSYVRLIMGNVSIDLSLSNVWFSWFAFRRSKKPTKEIDNFAYNLEKELWQLQQELEQKTYRHGGYYTFTVTDNKRRVISVAGIRDRVVHRLLYEYLLPIYDKSFYYDVWSCRPNKGLIGAIGRVQTFVQKSPNIFVWRTDITKFFDHVNRDVLITTLQRKVSDPKALRLLEEVLHSYNKTRGSPRERERERAPAKNTRESRLVI